MNENRDLDEVLRARFANLRDADARVAPDFESMFEQARRQSQGITLVTDVDGSGRIRPSRRWGRIALFTAGPLLTAAGLAGVWLNAERRADREFDQVVMAWTQTADQAMRSPTDGLLVLPGNEYLRSVPAIGRSMRNPRSGS
jgi:hypothetical protein